MCRRRLELISMASSSPNSNGRQQSIRESPVGVCRKGDIGSFRETIPLGTRSNTGQERLAVQSSGISVNAHGFAALPNELYLEILSGSKASTLLFPTAIVSKFANQSQIEVVQCARLYSWRVFWVGRVRARWYRGPRVWFVNFLILPLEMCGWWILGRQKCFPALWQDLFPLLCGLLVVPKIVRDGVSVMRVITHVEHLLRASPLVSSRLHCSAHRLPNHLAQLSCFASSRCALATDPGGRLLTTNRLSPMIHCNSLRLSKGVSSNGGMAPFHVVRGDILL